MKLGDIIFAIIGVVVFVVLVTIGAIALDCYVVYKLWNWFMPFYGLKPLAFGFAIPIALMINYVKPILPNKYEDMGIWKVNLAIFGPKLMFLAAGYLVHYFLT